MSGEIFNLDGTLSRKRKKPCKHCGALEECDTCWEHVHDWSPFEIWQCLACNMPMFVFAADTEDSRPRARRCDFCGYMDSDSGKCEGMNPDGKWSELEWSDKIIERPK